MKRSIEQDEVKAALPVRHDCEICDAAATVHIRDANDGTEHRYCKAHAPELCPGRKPKMLVLAYRLSPGNICSRLLASPPNSEQHDSFRREMCELKLLGADGACRYYLSIVTGRDQFAVWSDVFIENLRDLIIKETNGTAKAFRLDADTIYFAESMLKRAYHRTAGAKIVKLTKEDRAIELRLRNPDWTDQRIANEVPTTKKQLQRFTIYQLLNLRRNRT